MNKKCREDAVSKTGSRSNPRIFAMIAKFRWDCENFAIPAKLGIFARLAKFR